jgi:ATP-dependent Zn protease
MYLQGNPNRSFFTPPRIVRGVLVALGLIILLVFIVDKLLVVGPAPQQTTELTAVIAHLERHDVRRVTIPAHSVALELNDGKRLTADVPADRDLGPLIRRSGADLALTNAGPPDVRPVFGYVSQFVPFIIMALLVVFILRTVRRRSG